MLTGEQKASIIQAIDRRLSKRGAPLVCPMCSQSDFTIVEGYFMNAVNELPGRFTLGGKGVPTIALLCTNCGFLSHHALGVLGLMPTQGPPPGPPDSHNEAPATSHEETKS